MLKNKIKENSAFLILAYISFFLIAFIRGFIPTDSSVIVKNLLLILLILWVTLFLSWISYQNWTEGLIRSWSGILLFLNLISLVDMYIHEFSLSYFCLFGVTSLVSIVSLNVEDRFYPFKNLK